VEAAATASTNPKDWFQELDDQKVAKFLDEEANEDGEDRRLGDASTGGFGDLCGNRNPCKAGLECTKFGGVRRRCVPLTCLESSQVLQEFSLDNYKAKIFEEAGVTETQLLDSARGIRRNSFLESSVFGLVMDSLNEHAKVLDETVGKAVLSCMGKDVSSRNTTNPGNTNYLGLHIEGGFLLDGQFNYISAGDPFDTTNRIAYCRGCFGGEAGLGSEIGLLYGIAFTQEIGDMATCSFFGDLDGGLVLGGGVAIGIGFNGITFLEFNGGGSFDFGLGGQFCGTLPV
jgi:hypothetical protein